MHFRFAHLTAFVSLAVSSVTADADFSFCSDEGCQDCPVKLTSQGTGYPNCVIYNSDDIFPNQDPSFPTNSGGGWAPFINVEQPDNYCKVLIKSPAGASMPGCGKPIASFTEGVCSTVNLEKTFMVQFCCGSGDCGAAGVPFKRDGTIEGGVLLKYANGTIIPPAYMGPTQVPRGLTKVVRSDDRAEKAGKLMVRGVCEENSWTPDQGYEEYTRPADGSQVVYTGIDANQDVEIEKSRSTSFTQTLEAGLGIEEIFNIGLSFSVTEEISDSVTVKFTAPENQSGNVVFTPYWRCSRGSGTCRGETKTGEICTGYNDPTGRLAGVYSVVVTN